MRDLVPMSVGKLEQSAPLQRAEKGGDVLDDKHLRPNQFDQAKVLTPELVHFFVFVPGGHLPEGGKALTGRSADDHVRVPCRLA